MCSKEDYYKELHANLRHYDAKAWTVTVAFFAAITFVLSQIRGALWSARNAFTLILFGVISFLLLLKFLKEHAHSLWIQKKINEFDQCSNQELQGKDFYLKKDEPSRVLLERNPLFSMPSRSENEFSHVDMLVALKGKFRKDPYFDSMPGEERLIRLPVAKIFIWFMIMSSTTSFILGCIILIWHISDAPSWWC